MTSPSQRISTRFWQIAAAYIVLIHVPDTLASGCAVPDDGNRPYHRAVARIRYLPEIERWASDIHRAGGLTQYVLHLDRTLSARGRCYWTLEVRAAGTAQYRFFVSTDGQHLLADGITGPVPLARWRRSAH